MLNLIMTNKDMFKIKLFIVKYYFINKVKLHYNLSSHLKILILLSKNVKFRTEI